MPKLVFHSGQVLPQAEKIDRELLAMIGKKNPTFGYIPSASDTDYSKFHDRQAYYAQYGVNLGVYFELDQRYYPEILPSLLACDAIHIADGDAYFFLEWLRKREVLSALVQYAEKGGVLIGEGAGAILLTPDISTAIFSGHSPKDTKMDLTALRLVDFAFIPHLDKVPGGFRSVTEYSLSHHLPVYGCRDGDGIILHDEEMVRLGEVILVENGQLVTERS